MTCTHATIGDMKTTVIVPDLQMPYDDSTALKKLIKVIGDLQPEAVVQIGDLIDMPQVSRWTKGTAGEFTSTLQGHIDDVKSRFFSPLREAAPKAAITWVSGNHDERITDYLNKYGYPLKALDALSMDNLFELDRYGVDYVHGPVQVAPGTLAMHGHESGGYCASPGAWDLKFQKRYGSEYSFVFGHTHAPFLISGARGFGGNVKPRFTMNVGSVMDPAQATYVKDGAVNWSMGFGIIRDNGKEVWPELVLMNRKQFLVDGIKY